MNRVQEWITKMDALAAAVSCHDRFHGTRGNPDSVLEAARGVLELRGSGVGMPSAAVLAKCAEPAPTRERQIAFREAHELAAEDAYFEARPGTHDAVRARIFCHGFNRGWEAREEAPK